MNKITPVLSGKAMLCCIHHVEKYKYDSMVYDAAREKPSECLCCGNVFAYPYNVMDAPLMCPQCQPKGGSLNGKVV